MIPIAPNPPPPATTKRGTPCARSWTDEWVARVEQREDELDRRICGARTIGHAPCPAGSTHPSGRCVHHGGFDLTGAPEGNRNAAVHFLYARRVMPCGEHCPAWKSCPLGGGGADRGKAIATRAYADRPACPFEQAEYNAVVTDALKRTQFNHENAWGLHVAHQLALMTVLVSRAARSLATRPFVEEYDQYHGDQRTIGTKPSVGLIAYEKLARELRRWTILVERGYQWVTADQPTATQHRHRQANDTLPDPDALTATATGQGLFNHRGHRGHREDQPNNENDVGAGPCARTAHTGEPDRAATGSRPYMTTPDPSNSSDPRQWLSPLNSSESSVPSVVNALDLPISPPLTSSPSIPSVSGSNALDPNLRPSASSADEALDLIGENRCESVGNDLDLPDPSNPSDPRQCPSPLNSSESSVPSVVNALDLHKKNSPLTSSPSIPSIGGSTVLDPNLRPSAPSADNALDPPLSREEFLAGTADRIQSLIATHVPELLKPDKVSDPPGHSLRNILNPGPGP